MHRFVVVEVCCIFSLVFFLFFLIIRVPFFFLHFRVYVCVCVCPSFFYEDVIC